MKDKARLGRGLDALLGTATETPTGTANGLAQSVVPVARIEHNPYQPRKEFDDEELASLSASIREHGILQPLVVRALNGSYQLVAGERRLRAAQAAGLNEVPVRVVDFNDQQVLEAALVENIQRADLNPIEKAQGFKEYLDRFQMTHEQLAARLGLSRSQITNLVALLDMPAEVQNALRLGQITLGHAKVLKGADPTQQANLCKDIIARNLSVRETETILKQPKPEPEESAAPTASNGAVKSKPEKTPHVQDIEDELRQLLAVKLEIKLRDTHKGQFILNFESNDDFERIVEALRGK
ncbi:MAG: ParB/RepB/Spo0J family partition protein [Gemmataceae bacterium]